MADQCADCGATPPKPVVICFDCAEGVDKNGAASPGYYCSTACRAVDAEEHKTTCEHKNVRKSIYRAGELLQAIFYAWRRATFHLKVERIQKAGSGNIHIYEDVKYMNMSGAPLDPPLFQFSSEQAPDPGDEPAILSFRASSDANAYMYELSKKLLQDLATTIEEVDLQVHDSKWMVIKHFANHEVDPEEVTHEVLAVEARDGEAYIIDMAGAQLGQRRAVVPFQEYMKACYLGVISVFPLGDAAQHFKACREGYKDHEFPSDFDFRAHHVEDLIHGKFLEQIAEWEADNKMDIRQLLQCKAREFERGKVDLLEQIAFRLDFFHMEWKKIARYWVPPHVSRPGGDTEKPKAGKWLPIGNSRAYKKFIHDTNRPVMYSNLPNGLDEAAMEHIKAFREEIQSFSCC